ncbi:MAG: tRNA-guanine transglycosylase, queuosine-34-forming [Candidatus Eremiobacteraeota bacterium]|nr:tRNA-guanine transglycosylase, queuosine-34-forming [Candidatus Eremiobacteraeota bacterium]
MIGDFVLHARSGTARGATLTTAHGDVATPCFMPVGTLADVKLLEPRDLHEIGSRIVLANTYHLWLRPGRETLVAAGGIHRFMAWDGPILTDSGGFQVFSLESRREIDEDGVTFRSHLDGSAHRFTPENVVAFQEDLGVDVAMALDQCVKLPSSREELERAVARTTAWAQRCAAAQQHADRTMLFGIVQGGLEDDLRARSAAELVALNLPGYAIGGLSVGETREEMDRVARFTAALLPADKPRYLMGVGTVRDLVAGIDRGIDLFDCVYPTRSGRHGRVLTRAGDEYNVRNAVNVRDFGPVDPDCDCRVCATYTKAYLAHLFRSGETLAQRLLSYHNVAALTGLVRAARAAIEADRWAAFRDGLLEGAHRREPKGAG